MAVKSYKVRQAAPKPVQINWRDVSERYAREVIGHFEDFAKDDCVNCSHRIVCLPSYWRYFNLDSDTPEYNHSTMLDFSYRPGGSDYELLITTWEQLPNTNRGSSTNKVQLPADIWEIKPDSNGNVFWTHQHDTVKTRACEKALVSPRCPRCRSLQVQYLQEAYGDRTYCPDCQYDHFFSIGD